MVQAIGAGWFVLIALGSSHRQHRLAYTGTVVVRLGLTLMRRALQLRQPRRDLWWVRLERMRS